MRNFPALEWITIPGRGRMAMIPALPEGDELRNPRMLMGHRVMIDLGGVRETRQPAVSRGLAATPDPKNR